MRRSHQAAATAIAATSLVWAATSHAVDGVIEINQARALAGGVTTTDMPGFPVTIGTPGSYRLTGNLQPPGPLANGVEIDAVGVVLDLNGFAILGGTTCTDSGTIPNTVSCKTGGFTNVGIAGTATDAVRIRNGTVVGTTGSAIDLSDTRSDTLEDLAIGSSGDATACVQLGVAATVLRTRIGVCGGSGLITGDAAQISLSRTGANHLNGMSVGILSRITNSEANANGQAGIITTGSSVVSETITSGNGTDGVSSTGTDSTLTRIVASFNLGSGANLTAGSTYGESVFQNNATPVTGGMSRGDNVCNSVAC